MIENIKRINNPLTIIAIFAALAEINATVAIGLVDKDLHSIFIWFVMIFPTLLVILFFLTLNYNTKVMYSPSDYKDDKNFMDLLYWNEYKKWDYHKDDDYSEKISIELENKLTEKLQSKLNDLTKNITNPQIQKEIETLKTQLKTITDQSVTEVRKLYAIPVDLKEILLGFYRFPAYYSLIHAIVRSNAKNIDELKTASRKYFIPGEREDGWLPDLFEKKLLIGNNSNFEINPKFKESLLNWSMQNSMKLRAISNVFERKENNTEDTEPKFDERIKELTTRLRF